MLSFRLVDLNEAIGLAFLQEQKYWAQPKQTTRCTSFSKSQPLSLPQQIIWNPKSTPSISPSSVSPVASLPGIGRIPFKKLTPA